MLHSQRSGCLTCWKVSNGAQVSELKTQLEAVEKAGEEGRVEVIGQLGGLEARIDEALTESISVLKQVE